MSSSPQPRVTAVSFVIIALVVFQLAAVGVTVRPRPVDAMHADTPHPSAHDAFARTWARTDQPVASGAATRTWIWGTGPFTDGLTEPYADFNGTVSERLVQYYDKSRMEITYPDNIDDGLWYVTNGLLVLELITGRMQMGDAEFEPRSPASVNVAGDPGDPLTYATLDPRRSDPALPIGSPVTQRIEASGTLVDDPALAQRGVTAAHRVSITGLDHAIASVFWDFMNSSGAIETDGQLTHGPLFASPFYATGYPITEAYWATVTVGGTPLEVLLQCFERRCLTYTPSNPPEWRVEMGNVGQHYYRWRYETQESVTEDIDASAGGTVEVGEDLSVTFQPGALSTDTTVRITPLAPWEAPSNDTSKPVTQGYDIDLGAATLLAPVTGELRYDPALRPADSSNDAMWVGHYDEASGEWVPFETTVDASRQTLVFQADGFSSILGFEIDVTLLVPLLKNALSLSIPGTFGSIRTLTSECRQSDAWVEIDPVPQYPFLRVCAEGDGRIRVTNVRSFHIDVSSIPAGYPSRTVLRSGELITTTLNPGAPSISVNASMNADMASYLVADIVMSIFSLLKLELHAASAEAVKSQLQALIHAEYPALIAALLALSAGNYETLTELIWENIFTNFGFWMDAARIVQPFLESVAASKLAAVLLAKIPAIAPVLGVLAIASLVTTLTDIFVAIAQGGNASTKVRWIQPEGAPGTPVGVNASTPIDAAIRVAWTDGSTNETRFQINYTINGALQPPIDVASTSTPGIGDDYSRLFSNLPPGTTMCFQVAAFNSSGVGSAWVPGNLSTTCATTSAPGGVPVEGAILYQSPLSDWGYGETYWGEQYITNATLHLRVKEGYAGAAISNYVNDYADVSVSVEVRSTSSETGRGCLIVRSSYGIDAGSAYNLCVSEQNGATIAFFDHYPGGVYSSTVLLPEQTRAGTNPSAEWNTLKIISKESQFWFFANGTLLGTATHQGPSHGGVGIQVFAGTDAGAEFAFRNLVVRQLAN